MGFLLKILKWQERAEKLTLFLSGATITCILILTIADVAGRYFFSYPILGVYELLIILIPGLGFYSLAYVQRSQEHISVKFVLERLPLKFQRKLNKTTNIISLFTMLLLSATSASLAIKTWQVGETTVGIAAYPIGPAMIIIPIGAGLFCLRLFFQLIDLNKNGQL